MTSIVCGSETKSSNGIIVPLTFLQKFPQKKRPTRVLEEPFPGEVSGSELRDGWTAMDAAVKPTDPLQDQDLHSLTPSPPRSVGCYQPQDGSHPGNAFGQRELPHHSWESARIHDWSIWGYKSLAPWPKIQSWTFWRDIQAPKLPMGSAEVSV